MDMSDHGHLIERLRAFGREPMAPGVEGRVVARMASDGGRAKPGFVRRSLRVAPAAVLLVAAVPAAAAITAAMPDEIPAKIAPLDGEGGQGDLACTGQPPFAGQPPEGEGAERGVNRKAEAQEFSGFRSGNCPADEDAGDEAEEACTGAPTFAGESAEPASRDDHPSARASEARNLAETRANCHEPNEHASDAPAGPPSELPTGPPSELPTVVPTQVPTGPPTDTPARS